MLCENCRENDAVVNLTTIQDNAVIHQRLCERCAAAKGEETSVEKAHSPVGDFLQAVQQKAVATPGDQAACHFCHATGRDFRSSGRLGCARCYNAFEKSLRELLRRLHGTSRHVGRRYEPPADEMLARASTVGLLRERLRRAIDNEQFELAAELRDRLRTYEG